MKEAEYAGDKYAWVHKGLSLLIILGVVALALSSGHWSIGRTIMAFFVPFCFVWFPDEVAATNADLFSPRVIRWAGWCLLLIVVFLPMILRALPE